MVAVVFRHVEVYVAVADVGVTRVENFLHIFNLLDDVSAGVRLNAWRQHIEGFHSLVVAQQIELHHLHRFEFLEASLLCNLVLAIVGIVLKVSNVGDVAHIAHLIAQMSEVAEKHVESDGRTSVSQMRVAIDRRTANIHAYASGVNGFERHLGAREGIVNQECIVSHFLLIFLMLGMCD